MDILTVYKSRKGNQYIKPKLGQYGLKAIKVLTNEGEVIEFNENTVIQLKAKTIKTRNGEMNILEGWSTPEMLKGEDTRQKQTENSANF